MNVACSASTRKLFAIVGFGLATVHCGGSSSSTAKGSDGGSSGTGGAQAGAGMASGASAGKASTGTGGSSGGAGGSSNAGRGQSGGSSGTGGSAGSAGSAAVTGGSSGDAGSGTGGVSGSSGSGAGGSSGTGGDSGAAGAGGDTWKCDLVCDDGTCWQDLNGESQCASDMPDEPAECFSSDMNCCTADSECTDGAGGRCIPNRDTVLSCGGAIPSGNSCNYDACTADADCEADLPADSTVAACVPPGALANHTNACVYGVCRTDADCTKEAGGQCIYGFAATHNGCDLRLVLSCAYPSDPCQMRYGDCDGAMVCAPEEDLQGQHCVNPPPMYP